MGQFTPSSFNLAPVVGGGNTGFGGPLTTGPGGNYPQPQSSTPFYSGNMSQDANNYWQQYPGYQSVFNKFDGSGNPTSVNPLFDVTTPTTVGTGADFTKAQNATDSLSHVVYNPDGSYNQADSPLAQGQLAQLATGYQNSVDQTQRNNAGQYAGGLNSLEMMGGADSGAWERMAENAQTSGNAALQSGVNQYDQGQQAIRTNDANYKAGIQRALPGMYQGLDQYSTGNQFRDVGNKMSADSFNAEVAGGGLNGINNYNMGKYDMGGNVLGSLYASGAMGGAGNPYAPAGGYQPTDTSHGIATDAVGNNVNGIPGVGTFTTVGNMAGNFGQGDFSEGTNHYEDMVPGVTTGKTLYNTWAGKGSSGLPTFNF